MAHNKSYLDKYWYLTARSVVSVELQTSISSMDHVRMFDRMSSSSASMKSYTVDSLSARTILLIAFPWVDETSTDLYILLSNRDDAYLECHSSVLDDRDISTAKYRAEGRVVPKYLVSLLIECIVSVCYIYYISL